MKQESLPAIKSVYHALEEAAVDIYGFAVVCQGGAIAMAEPVILDTLLLGLENFWFTESRDGRLTHREFREEIFRAIWDKSRDRGVPVRIGTDVPLGHDAMHFYQLPQLARAVIYLRTKRNFSYASIAIAVGVSEGMARSEVERAREFLLGRRMKAMNWGEEEF